MIITLHPEPRRKIAPVKGVTQSMDRLIAEMPDGTRLKPRRGPIFGTARDLLARGVDPGELLEFRHAGSPIIAARGIAGELARWTVFESDKAGLQKKLWAPMPEGMPRRPIRHHGKTAEEGLAGV